MPDETETEPEAPRKGVRLRQEDLLTEIRDELRGLNAKLTPLTQDQLHETLGLTPTPSSPARTAQAQARKRTRPSGETR